MTQAFPTAKNGENFTVADFGKFSDLQQFTFKAPEIPLKAKGKIFLKQILNLSSAEISFNSLLPETSIPFYHKHSLNEEVYIFIQGQGEFQVDDHVFPVGEGTVVQVAPEGERCMQNISSSQNLSWIVIQSQANSYEGNTIGDGFAVEKKVSWIGKEQI